MKVSLRDRGNDRDRNARVDEVAHRQLSCFESTGMIAKAIVKIRFAVDTDIYLCLRVLQERDVMRLDQCAICADCELESGNLFSRVYHCFEVRVEKWFTTGQVER